MADSYRIEIGEQWSLEDLYVFARTYEQVYFLAYSLLPDLPHDVSERVTLAYAAFPWRGGYSAVDFYDRLKYAIPRQEWPNLGAISYGSPGFLELLLVRAVASVVSGLVKDIAGSLREMNATYNEIVSDLRKRKLLRLDVRNKEIELSRAELHLVEEQAEVAARFLGFEGHEELTGRTGNPYITLKILLSFYRRLRTLAEFSKEGKADL